MKKSQKKLTLHRETILSLTGVVGGKVGVSGGVICIPTVQGTACMPDSTPDNGCQPSAQVPCNPTEWWCSEIC